MSKQSPHILGGMFNEEINETDYDDALEAARQVFWNAEPIIYPKYSSLSECDCVCTNGMQVTSVDSHGACIHCGYSAVNVRRAI